MATVEKGQFKSLKLSDFERYMLEDAYQAVEKCNGWDFLRQDDVPGNRGFMFSRSAKMDEIDKNMKFDGHSGASHALTMRTMEFIAKQGWEAYAKKVGVKANKNFPHPCACHAAEGKDGWCGVAGGGVPACDH